MGSREPSRGRGRLPRSSMAGRRWRVWSHWRIDGFERVILRLRRVWVRAR